MPPRPRLVASDLDGTLLDGSGAVTRRTARAWRSLDAAGIETVLVTARPPRWVDHLAEIVGEHGVVLCANGAFVYDVARRRIRETRALAPDVVRELITDLRVIDGITFSAELPGGFHREPGYPAGTPDGVPEIGRERVGSLEGLAEPVGKLLARSLRLEPQTFLAEVARILGDRALLSVSTDCGLAEIGPAGVTKAQALADWTGRLGIDAVDVWAFGDMPNDIPMLSWAGIGWAVANAHPDVRVVADRQCGANTEDGPARVLEGMLDGREVDGRRG